jgi:hypothetical protein
MARKNPETIKAVLDRVGSDPTEAAIALRLERASDRPRKRLIARLEQLVLVRPTGREPAPAAAKFRSDILDRYELSVTEMRILEEACREIDIIERMQEELDGDASLVSRGSMGQPVAHPLAQEIRQHRSTLDRLIKSLNLPEEDPAVSAGARSESARDRARKRWSM